MKCRFLFRASLILFAGLTALSTCAAPAIAQTRNSQGKTLTGFFEEWSIYYANYNLANLESNGSGAKLSHLVYAFADVSASASAAASDTCLIADP
jgi:chitinase